MKKGLIAMLMSSAALFAMSCDDEKVISESKLPEASKDFIAVHFPDQSVTRVVKDTEGSTEYDVKLDNGFSLEFNKSGNWREVEGYSLEVPESFQALLPAGISAYIDTNHSAQTITKVELTRNGNFEVNLNTGIEILFSSTGEFVRYDD